MPLGGFNAVLVVQPRDVRAGPILFLWFHALSHFDVIRRLDNSLVEGELTNTGELDEVWVAPR